MSARESFDVLLREAEIRRDLGRSADDLLPLLGASWLLLTARDREETSGRAKSLEAHFACSSSLSA